MRVVRRANRLSSILRRWPVSFLPKYLTRVRLGWRLLVTIRVIFYCDLSMSPLRVLLNMVLMPLRLDRALLTGRILFWDVRIRLA